MVAAMKHMVANFSKRDKFEGVDFRRWQKKIHFLLSTMSMVYVLTIQKPEDGENAIVEQSEKREKWDNDDYVCHGIILNGMSDSLFDLYQNVESRKELYDPLEAKYMAEDASSKMFLVSNFTNYKMTDSRPVMEQYNELLGILGRFTQHKINMDEAIQVSCIIDKLPLSWKYFKHTLKHKKEELTFVKLGSHLHIDESLRVQDSDKPKGNNVVSPLVVNMVEHNNSTRYNDNKGKRKHHDNTRVDPNTKAKPTCWKCGKTGHIKRDCKGVNVGSKGNYSCTSGLGNGSVTLKGHNMFNKSIHVCYVTYVSESNYVQDDDVAWWIDLRVVVHVFKDRCCFKTYESLNDESILHMEIESTALVHGRGCVHLRFSSGKIVSLFKVLHVHIIRKNLVSISGLNNYGYKQVTESNKFVLSKHDVFIGFGYLSNRLNIVYDIVNLAFISTSKLNDLILWHARLCHVHFKRMQDMSKDGLIPAFDMDTEKCKTCMLTKITKKPFQNVKRETEVLELIHSNLCDLHATPSSGNKKYFVTFINDASRFCYVYLLHTKDEALDKFKVFKTKFELQQGSLIKRYRTDRGGTDIAKITRKRSKPNKHGHETERVNKRRKGFNNAQSKLNHALQEQLKEEKKINEKTSSKKVSQCISKQIPHQKKNVLGGELLTESLSKINLNENVFIPASMNYDHEMVPKSKDWVERLNPDNKLPNFNAERILLPKSQVVNESLKPTEASIDLESSKDYEARSLTPLPLQKILQGASPSLEVMSLTFQSHSLKERYGLVIMKHTKPETQDSLNKSVLGTVTVSETESTTPSVPTEVKNTEQESKINELTKLVQMILYCMICKKEDHRTSDHEMYFALLKRSKNYKAQPYQYASPSKQILKAKEKPFPPCTHYGFNDHIPDDCKNYPECEICGSYDHFTLGHNCVIHIRGCILAESSQSCESSIGVKCNTCGSTVHSTTDHNEFDRFKRGEKIQATKAREPTKNISQLCDAKYIVQFDDKQGTIFNANKEIVLIAPRRNDVYVLDMSSPTPNRAWLFSKASKSVNWLWDKRLSHLNFKNINKLAKQNKVLGLPLLVYSKDKPCSACEKGKHHRASFKTKQNFSIRKCLHLLHMNLFRPFCDEKGISPNLSSPYTPKQNGLPERNNRTLIKATRTMLNGSVLSKHLWIKAVRIACYTQKRSIIVKRHDTTPYEIFRERIHDINYFHVFGCPMFIHNHKDHLGKFDAKADDGYFLGYSFISKAFRVLNTRRQQVEETYHVTFDESMEAIKFTNTSVDEIGIDDSSRYPPDEFIHKDDPSRQYQANSDISYYHETPHSEDAEGPSDLINIEGTHEQNVQDEKIITQPTKGPSGNNTKVLVSIIEFLVPNVPQSQISHQASISSHRAPQDRWSKDQHIKLVNIIGDLGEGMLTRSMAVKLTTTSASSKWVFKKKKDGHGITTKNKARLVAQGYSQEKGINYAKTFPPVARMEAFRIFLAFATYTNFIFFQIDVKSAFLNGKLKEEVYVKKPPGFESSEFPGYACKLDKAHYGLKQALVAWYETLSTFLIQNKFAKERICDNPSNLGRYFTLEY
ncbi:zinc finger, CCHC-type containing protein [Tanacetum coccineum]